MQKIVLFLLLVLIASPGRAQQFSLGLDGGYFDGTAFRITSELARFIPGSGASVRAGILYSRMNPGNSADARRIFINNATNGVPEKYGRIWNFQFDLLLPYSAIPLPGSRIVVGVRHASFLANFKFVGGNEDFDVTSTHWGIGTGIESRVALSRKIALKLGAGVDYYFSGVLQGHDTSYDPDGDNINPRENYTYADADKAVNQPKLEFHLTAGFNYSF
jgi:hypothetical protein